MQDFITSYLVQTKECALPLLGNFKIQRSPAFLNVPDKELHPGSSEIVYTENANYVAGAFADYISRIQKISWNEAEEKINNWCLEAKMKLDAGEKIVFDSIGSLQKNDNGEILFEKNQPISFFEPIHVERVIHKNETHAVLVGDKETTSSAMNEFYSEEIVEEKSNWKKWATALAAVGILILIIYFANHRFSDTGVGNQSSIPVAQPAPTYSVPK